MTNLVQRNLPTISRDEWLTPFDNIFDTMFKNAFPQLSGELGQSFFSSGSYPKVDVEDQAEKIVIEAELPGMTQGEVAVDIEKDNTLVISGGKQQKTDNKGKNYLLRELKKSSFKRSFYLGEGLDKEKVSASFENGILKVEVPKLKPSLPTKRSVEIAVK